MNVLVAISTTTTRGAALDMSNGELTDAAYWDGVWDRTAPARPLSSLHPYYGRHGRFLRMVRQRLGDIRGARVLEVGAGGTNYRLLALNKWAGAQVSAIDYSEVGLRVLRDVFATNGCRVDTILGDFLTTPVDGLFDVVVHWGVLEHFEDPTPMLAACRRALKPHGRLLFSMPNLEAWAARWWARYSPTNWSRHILHSEMLLRESCATAGLSLDASFYFGHPAIKMSQWERKGLLPMALSAAQRLVTIAGSVAPIDKGLPWLSGERGVLAHVL